MGYSIRAYNYLKRIALCDSTLMMNMVNPIAINAETLRIDSRCSLDKDSYESFNGNYT